MTPKFRLEGDVRIAGNTKERSQYSRFHMLHRNTRSREATRHCMHIVLHQTCTSSRKLLASGGERQRKAIEVGQPSEPLEKVPAETREAGKPTASGKPRSQSMLEHLILDETCRCRALSRVEYDSLSHFKQCRIPLPDALYGAKTRY